ncbi:MAG: energy-coupling factor ABC transporter ATP-binding protein [Lactobacillus equicursoris]|uniref:energy-coupling factor ABC transporter ATP-binding protein n=1 Tax=Lactobacillus equicursoris TaxID=420645 RepID=UPI002431E4F7|nr:energy-coupling factor ABC transporter ATP-binding protein [Lactobacillus equicursoris]MDD6406762.1 energy-coupling factor ABC transporter ATP-binding protein [Lactobacillus equicursoris]
MSDKIINFDHVTFSYPDTESPAVKDLSFSIEKGSWTALIGHNGSGKSTVSKLINGLLAPDDLEKSTITVDGVKLAADTVWDIREKVGIVFQNPDNQFVGATVSDDVAFGLENRAVAREEMVKIVAQAVADVGMADYAGAEPSSLSGGQKQRVAIAGILAVKPKVMILDESTSMLDPEGKQQILDLVRRVKEENDLTVISITHDLDEAALADQVLVMDDGVLIDQGIPREIFAKVDLMEKIGLDIPFVYRLKQLLSGKGIQIPETVTSEEELVKSLCQLNSKM